MTAYEQYREYLLSAEWKRIRLAKLKEVGYRCENCGVDADHALLDCHHRQYRLWGTERMADLEVLCRDCHDFQHLAPREILRVLGPPPSLVSWLDRVIAAKKAKGHHVPDEITRWLARWGRIRRRLPNETDMLDEDRWQGVKSLSW